MRGESEMEYNGPMTVEKFRPAHVQTMALQGQQILVTPLLSDPDYIKSLMDAGPSFSGIVGGRVIVCAGIIIQWENRALAWSLIAGDLGPLMISVHRAVSEFLDRT